MKTFTEDGGAAALAHVRRLVQSAAGGGPTLQQLRNKVVVAGAGTWDMRDNGVDVFLGDFRKLLAELIRLRSHGIRVFYRAAPAWPAAKTSEHGRHRMTNDKLAATNAVILSEAASAGVPVWNSFAITLPRFEDAVDAVQFLTVCRVHPK